MLAEERRAALAVVTIPLLCRHGLKVTTRQIAEAAGVAEGTIFRVFKDKNELVQVTIATAFDPDPTLVELDRVDPTLPLRIRLMGITAVLQRRLQLMFDLMIALGMSAPPEEVEERRHKARPTHQRILARIEQLLEPDRDHFRCPVPEVVRLLRLITFSGSHPMITDGQTLSAQEITDLLLDGVRRRTTDSTDDQGDHPC